MGPIYRHMVSDFVLKDPYYIPNGVGSWHYYASTCYRPITLHGKKLPITGKHLFFSKSSRELEKVVIDEIENDFFWMGKIISEEALEGNEYVLCLYDYDDSMKAELKEKYRGNQNVEYGGWKSDEETRKEQRALMSVAGRAFEYHDGDVQQQYIGRGFVTNHDSLTGNHHFLSKRYQELKRIIINEIENDSFFAGEITTKPVGGGDFVLRLRDRDDSRKAELEGKYRGNRNVRYVGWKSDEEITEKQRETDRLLQPI